MPFGIGKGTNRIWLPIFSPSKDVSVQPKRNPPYVLDLHLKKLWNFQNDD
jgi:hypothetical protein